MIKAWKEYWNEVLVPAGKWLEKHWKGFSVLTVAVYVVVVSGIFIWFNIDMISDKIGKIFKKEEKP